jgi:hypothetical protein
MARLLPRVLRQGFSASRVAAIHCNGRTGGYAKYSSSAAAARFEGLFAAADAILPGKRGTRHGDSIGGRAELGRRI